jgi:hypothetical protein
MPNEKQAASQMNALEISIERMCASSDNGLGPMEAEFNTGIWNNSKQAGRTCINYSVFLNESTGFSIKNKISSLESEPVELDFGE